MKQPKEPDNPGLIETKLSINYKHGFEMIKKTLEMAIWATVLVATIFASIGSFALGALLSESAEVSNWKILGMVSLTIPASMLMKFLLNTPNRHIYAVLLLPIMCFWFAFFTEGLIMGGGTVIILLFTMLAMWGYVAKKMMR